MKTNAYVLSEDRLQQQTAEQAQVIEPTGGAQPERWLDLQDATPEELRTFLEPLGLHPLQLARCLDSVNDPGVVSVGSSILMEYPASFKWEATEPAYLSILLQENILVTIRHGDMPALDELIQSLMEESAPPVLHLPQIIYMILDQFADLNVEAQVTIRDQIVSLSNNLATSPASVSMNELSSLRAQVENLVSLVENQLYCISALNACDNAALRDPHRKAYVQDLLSEIEIAQAGVYRLEARLKDLYSDFQAAGNDRVEKRLRVLTIVSAITLPLGLVAGLLGMNVGGIPLNNTPPGFLIVFGLMVLIVVVEYWYFKRKGWFD